jgi:predicted phage terminase large subunit-like protein
MSSPTQPTVNTLIRSDFASFVRKAYRHDHSTKLGDEPYLAYLCHELEGVANGETRRLLINLPPRHLKTFLAAIYLPAWVLAHDPSARIMVITYSERLAELITYHIRKVLRASWFKALFTTRVAKDRSKAGDFATTAGGGVFATSVNGALAGRGADLIIFDDPLDLKDAGNAERIALVNQRFDSLIMSRLNNPKTGQVVIIAHRLNENDLSAHVGEQGDYCHVILSLIAKRKKSYDLGGHAWVRKRGELLRPGSFTPRELKRLEQNTLNPDFGLLYQQGTHAARRLTIKPRHFDSFDPNSIGGLPIILSIDPGHRGSVDGSYCVIQAWTPHEGNQLLVAQWREQCGYEQLRNAYWKFVRRFRPSVALIEATANGPALIADAKRRSTPRVVEIVPGGRSKAARLLTHVPLIRKSRVLLPATAPWRADYIKEMVEFPSAPFDDQVDATTQYLDWIAVNPVPALPPARAFMVGIRGDGLPLTGNTPPAGSVPGIVITKESLAAMIRRSSP